MTTVLMHAPTVVGREAVYVCRQTECSSGSSSSSSGGGGYIDCKAAFCQLLYQWRRFLLNGGGQGGGVPSGVQEQRPWSGGQRGIAPRS